VSTFYLLPPRPLLGEQFARYLQEMFPGLEWPSDRWGELADLLRTVAAAEPDVFIVHREELPEGESQAQALRDGFGAEAGDEVIELRSGPRAGELTANRWRLELAGW
jgi:hypothetical protein